MKHKVAQLKTEITINQIKAQREQRRKNKNNSLILHTTSDLRVQGLLHCTTLATLVIKFIEKQGDMKDHSSHTCRKIFSNWMAGALFMNWCTFSQNTPQTSSVGKTQRDLILFLSYFKWSTCKCKS